MILPSLFALTLLASAPAPMPKLGPVATLKVGGEGGWDYVSLDAAAGRIYLPRSTRVMVLDLEGRSKGVIPDTAGVHGVAFSRELDRGWTSNGRANTVTAFKLSTLAVLQTLKTTGENPDAILFEPVTRQVFTFNGRGKNATVFDATTGAVTGTMDLSGKPEFAVCDGKGRVFVNNEDTSEIFAIDARTRTVAARWSIKPVEEPSGLAMDAEHGLLFTVGRNKLMAVVDAATGKVVTTLPIGARADGVAYDPGTGCAYVSNGEGTVTVARRGQDGRFAVTATVTTRKGAGTLAVDEKTHRLYLPSADYAPLPADAKPGQRPAMVPDSFQLLVLGETH
jgi:DNA-binding beta-propeller fold protein YncE